MELPYDLLMPIQFPYSNQEPTGVNSLPYLSTIMSRQALQKLGKNEQSLAALSTSLEHSSMPKNSIGRRPNTQQVSFRPSKTGHRQHVMIEPKMIDERFLNVSKANLLDRRHNPHQNGRPANGLKHPASALNNTRMSHSYNNSYR